MPFLADHDRKDFIGQVKNPRFQDKNLFADATFSTNPRPQEVLKDIKAGLRPWSFRRVYALGNQRYFQKGG